MKKTAISLILALAMVLSFVLVAAPQAQAAGHTTHCVCGGKAAGVGDHTACANVTETWVDLNAYVNDAANKDADGYAPLKAGAYYLSADLQLEKQLKPIDDGVEITICLNGFELKGNADKAQAHSKVMFVNKKATVNICDCKGTGKMSSISEKQGAVILVDADKKGPVLNLFSGTLIGSPNTTAAGGNVRINDGGVLNIYKAILKDGKNVNGQGGNLMSNGSSGKECEINMFGGAILNGNAKSYGGNIYIMNSVTLNISGGTISGGVAGTAGKDIYADKESSTIKIKNLEAGTACTLTYTSATLDVSELAATVTKGADADTDPLTFTHTFTAAAATPSTPSNPSKPNNPATGDSANLVVMGLGLVLGVAGIACLLPKKQEI